MAVGGRYRLIIEQDALGRPVEIVELAGAHAPQEGEKPQSAEAQCDGNEEQKNGHDALLPFTRPARRALSTTTIDELDMARAAISGVTRPRMASGTAARL